jgi:hypothetical protein
MREVRTRTYHTRAQGQGWSGSRTRGENDQRDRQACEVPSVYISNSQFKTGLKYRGCHCEMASFV